MAKYRTYKKIKSWADSEAPNNQRVQKMQKGTNSFKKTNNWTLPE